MSYDWNFARLSPYFEAFVSGTVVTLTLTFVVILLGTLLGMALGLLLRNKIVKCFLYPLVDVVRALPPLVLILFMYYFLTQDVIGCTINAYWVCVIAMSLNLSAFVSDLVRAAIESVSRYAIDAGKSLGMNNVQIIRYILLPRVIREIMPGMVMLYISILKMSSLASIVNVREIVYSAQTIIAHVSRSLEAWTIVALIYIAIVIPMTYFARWIEMKLGRGMIEA